MALQQFGRTKGVSKRSSKYAEEALYVWLFKDGGSEVSVRQKLNEFIKSRKRVYKWEVGDTLKKLRERNLYYPALKQKCSRCKTKVIAGHQTYINSFEAPRHTPSLPTTK